MTPRHETGLQGTIDVQAELSSAAFSGDLFDESVLLNEAVRAVENGQYPEADSRLRTLYGRIVDRCLSSHSEDAKDLRSSAQLAYDTLRDASPNDVPDNHPLFYLGQLNAVMELATRLAQRTVPYEAAHLVKSSSIVRRLLLALHEEGPLTVTSLAEKAESAQPYISSQLPDLEANRLVRRRRYGRNVEVTILPLGRHLLLEGLRSAHTSAPSGKSTRTLPDSVDTSELVIAFEKEFDIDIPDEDAKNLRTFDDAAKYLHDKLQP